MKRFSIILAVILAAVVAGLAVTFYGGGLANLFPSTLTISSTLYDVDADGEIELVRWSIGDSMVLWRWDRDSDGSPELVAYDAAVAADGTLRPAGEITAWDWGGDSVIDEGEVPALVEALLQQEDVAAGLAAPASGDIALVGSDIQRLVADIAAGYDDWRLSGFRMPIVGASLPDLTTLFPGAPRAYRNGVHQGFDFMPGHVGVPTGYSAPVVAVKEGVVIRADVDYTEMTPEEYTQAIETSKAAGATPPDILDKLRGRQVWIDHGAGVVSRYAHLSGVASGIVAGERVEGGDIIGFVGNSGMEAGTRGSRSGAHLHYEMQIDGRYLGEGLSNDEIRALASRIFGLTE